jgi:hypothetical protein
MHQTLWFYDIVAKGLRVRTTGTTMRYQRSVPAMKKFMWSSNRMPVGRKVLSNVQRSRIKDSCRLIQMTNPTDISDLYLSDPKTSLKISAS